MRMRELELRSGVGRETIRYYMREGLLPQPERLGRTSALYTQAHVDRLLTIRRLQDERFLPLSVIKSVLNADVPPPALNTAFPDIARAVAQALMPDGGAPVAVAVLAEQIGVPVDYILDYERIGMVRIDRTDALAPTLSALDGWLLRRIFALGQAGFSRGRGFGPEAYRFYMDLIDWMTAEEVRLFFRHMPGQATDAEAVRAGIEGIRIMNEIIGALRMRGLLQRLSLWRQGDEVAGG
jgi:DNA-binding transcriptional MerR regulator